MHTLPMVALKVHDRGDVACQSNSKTFGACSTVLSSRQGCHHCTARQNTRERGDSCSGSIPYGGTGILPGEQLPSAAPIIDAQAEAENASIVQCCAGDRAGAGDSCHGSFPQGSRVSAGGAAAQC